MTNRLKNQYACTDYNLHLMEKYTENEDNGLFLLSSPTGSGKTHAIIEYIKKNLKKDKKFVYAIPVKNNLYEFKDKLFENLTKDQQKEVLILKSIIDELIDWFEAITIEDEYMFSQWNEYKKLISLLNLYKSLKKNNGLALFDEKELSRTGNLLLYKIKKQYLDYKNDKKAKEKLEKDAKRIFKFLDIDNYSIILTSASKFINKTHTLISNNFIWEMKSFKKAVVFLDEFDSHKSYYLDSIISKLASSSIDLIELFRLMADTFKNMTYINKFNYDFEYFQPIKEQFLKIYEDKYLKYVVDTNIIETELDSLPILIDSNFSTFNLQNDSKKLFINIDEDNEQLQITDIQTDNSYLLSELLKDISQVINRYILFCRSDVNKKISKFKEIDIYDKKELNLDNFVNAKIHDNIKIFGLSSNDDKYDYLKNQIKNHLYSKKKFKKDLGKRKWNFYQNGFSLINISKDYLDSNIADLEYINMSETPEGLLIDICNELMIIGVSATANMNTVIKNFDIDYLKSNVKFSQVNEDEVKYMQELYLDSKNQRNRNFYIETINESLDKEQNIIEFCKRNFSSCINTLNYIKEEKIYDFYLNQYINFIDCYRRFLEEDSIHSMIYFSNRYIRDTNMKDNVNYIILMHLLVNMIKNLKSKNSFISYLKEKINEHGKNILEVQKKEHIFFMEYKKDTENDYKDYIENNKEYGKIFIYANYKRIGTGKNLEYEKEEFVKKDYDAIFLEKPTKLILQRIQSNEDKLYGIFQIESLFRNYIINRKEYKNELKKLFIKSQKQTHAYTNTKDNIEAIMQVIIQAIGRLHRTNSNSDMFLFIDNTLIESIKRFHNSNIPLLPSAIKLIEYYSNGEINKNIRNENEFENKLNELTKNLENLIKYALKVFKNPTNEGNINDVKIIWLSMRKFFLKYPTIKSIHDTEIKKYSVNNEICHIEVYDKKYICYQGDDYNEISLIKKDGFNKVEISEEAANLHLIRNCPELKEFAAQNEIETTFKYETLLIPNAFNNIYKGALGEVIGKYIIEKYCSINLEELDESIEQYESFDYKNDKHGIYFDFKYYSQRTLEYSREDIINNVNYKLQSNKLKKAFIINIFSELDGVASVIPNGNVIFIPYLVNSTNKNNPYIDSMMIEIIKGALI